MRNNWKELPDFIRFCNELKANAWFNVVYAPTKFALWTLDSSSLNEIHKHLSDCGLPDASDIERQNKNHYLDNVKLIGKWYENALTRENTTEAEMVDISDHRVFLSEKVKTLVANDGKLTASEKELKITQLTGKIDNLIERFSGSRISQSHIQPLLDLFSEDLFLKTFENETEESIHENIEAILSN